MPSRLDEHAARLELLDRRDDLVVAAAARVAQRVGVERAAEHGRRGDDLRRQLAERGEPRAEQLADRRPAAATRRVRLLAAERVEVLDHEERQPAALAMESRGELAVAAGGARRARRRRRP